MVASWYKPSQGCPPKSQQSTSAIPIPAHLKPSSQRLLSCLAVIFSQQNARQNQGFLLQEKGSHSRDRWEELMGLGTALRLKSSSSRPYFAVTCTKIWLFPFSCQMERKRSLPGQRKEKHLLMGQVKQSDAGLNALLSSPNKEKIQFPSQKKPHLKIKRQMFLGSEALNFGFQAQMICSTERHVAKPGLTQKRRGVGRDGLMHWSGKCPPR